MPWRRRLPPDLRRPARLKLGASIRQARRAVGLTQEALGRRVGLKGRAIYRWERNESAPSSRHRLALIREVHQLNPQAGLELQNSFTRLTGKAHEVVFASATPTPTPQGPAPFAPLPNAQGGEPLPAPLPASHLLEFAILKMADELDVTPRRTRRALGRLFERLRSANVSFEFVRSEVERMLGQE